MLDKKNALNDEKLENVNGGYSHKIYGDSYSGKESETVPPGTHVIYTEKDDAPHYAAFVRYAGGNFIVLRPDDQECRDFFEYLYNDESSYMGDKDMDGYKIYYTWATYNHLYKA